MNYIIIIVFLLFSVMLIADKLETEVAAPDSAEAAEDSAVLQAHRFFAADFFNKCWDLIDKKDRTPEEDLQMIHLAHASRAHWEVVGNSVNFAVGEWQISRVYAILNRPQEALYYAQACLNICQKNNISGFNLGFAYEALARAEFLLGNVAQADEYIALGKKAAAEVEIVEDREYLLGDLNSIKK